MWELGGERPLSSNFFSMLLRAFYLLIAGGGWALWVFDRFNPTEGTDPFVWVVAVSVVIGMPLVWFTARIEQYLLHARWGVGFTRAVYFWLQRQPEEVQISFRRMSMATHDENSEVRKAIDANKDSE